MCVFGKRLIYSGEGLGVTGKFAVVQGFLFCRYVVSIELNCLEELEELELDCKKVKDIKLNERQICIFKLCSVKGNCVMITETRVR